MQKKCKRNHFEIHVKSILKWTVKAYDMHARGMRKTCNVHEKCVRNALKRRKKCVGSQYDVHATLETHQKRMRSQCEVHVKCIENC